MKQKATSKAIILFEESIKSKYTKANYSSHLRQFVRFAKVPSAESIADIPSDCLQGMVEDYLLHLKRTKTPNSIPASLQGIRHFCVMNRLQLSWEIIYKMLPKKSKPSRLRAWSTVEIKEMLKCAKSPRDAAIILLLASTGARIGIFDHTLKAKHVQPMPGGCKAVLLYAGDVEEYWSFLTPQASRALDKYYRQRRARGEEITGESFVFLAGGPAGRQLGWNGARSAVYRIVSRSRIQRGVQNGRYEVQIDHGFRKRFNTILKTDNAINYNIAEKLMGHKNGLDGVYLTPTIQECFAEFKKASSRLEIR